MTSLEAFVPAVISHLVWSVISLIAIGFALAIADRIARIRRRHRYLKFAPRYAIAYLMARAATR
ncbi:MAG: hypothetical protein HOM12_05475 [Proteobacteria bacterium]|jgi:hypothetical protein|nr:hypothetical protein [Pseudomonadota bacterium]MBT5816923.1 hypothetical protein [Pseudomonadota bacterium]MBT6347992.1 hypothetical protein [Pseudomonadota bacterium]